MTTQQEIFLSEHNKLSPLNLRATNTLLSRFKEERPSLFKNDDWPMEKLRRPFIMWLTALESKKGRNHKIQPINEKIYEKFA